MMLPMLTPESSTPPQPGGCAFFNFDLSDHKTFYCFTSSPSQMSSVPEMTAACLDLPNIQSV